MWNDLLSAFALMLVLEGLLPFITPKGFREKMLLMLQMNDNQIRFASLTAMLLGVFMLYIVRN